MEKIANLYLEDLFAWGVWQKIRLTNNREITFKEIEDFALEVGKQAKLKGIKYNAYLNRDLTNQFICEYKKYITVSDKSLTLNGEINYKQSLNIFHMGTVSLDMLPILLNDNIGKKIFKQKENENE